MPCVLIQPMAREVPALQRWLHAALSREIVQSQRAMMVLGFMCAEERMARFLLDVSMRSQRCGLSGHDLHLSMTRIDIGSYLGLTLETVSRMLSIFERNGLLRVKQRQLRIVDMHGLERLLQGH